MITRTGQWRCCTNKSPNQRRTTFGTQLDATGLPLFQYRRIAGIFLESVLAWKSYTISCLLLQQIIGFQKKPRKACAFVASKSTVYIDGVACRLCHICHVPRVSHCGEVRSEVWRALGNLELGLLHWFLKAKVMTQKLYLLISVDFFDCWRLIRPWVLFSSWLVSESYSKVKGDD